MNAITEAVNLSAQGLSDLKSLLHAFQRGFEEKRGQNLTFFERRLLAGFVVQTDRVHYNPMVNPHLFGKNKVLAASRAFIDGLERFAKAHQIPCAFSIASCWVGDYAVGYISTDEAIWEQLEQSEYRRSIEEGCRRFESTVYQDFINSFVIAGASDGQHTTTKTKAKMPECFNGYFSKSFDLYANGVAAFDDEKFLDYSGFARNQSTHDGRIESLVITDLIWLGPGVFRAKICSDFITHGKKVAFNFNPIFDFAIRQLAGVPGTLKLNFEHCESIDTHLLKLAIAPEKEHLLLATKSKIDNLSKFIASEIF